MAVGLYTFVVWNISVYGGDIEGNEDCVRISLLFINYILCAEKTLVVHRASKK